MRIVVPKSFSVFGRIDGFIRQIEKVKHGEKVEFDLSKITFVNPNNLIMLITTSSYVSELSGKVVSWVNIENSVSAYLERLDICNYSFIEFTLPQSFLRFKRSKGDSTSMIELILIDDWKSCADAIKRTKEILNRWFPNQSSKVTNDICSLIKETTENSVEHSNQEDGYGFCFYVLQKYTTNKGDQVQIAISDVGIGIRKSLKKVVPNIVSNDLHAIKKALFEGLSSREDDSGGLGYKRVRESLKHVGGVIQIRSGHGSLEYSSKKDDYIQSTHKCSLVGTQTFFAISS